MPRPSTYEDFAQVLRGLGAVLTRTRGAHEQWRLPNGHNFTLPVARRDWRDRRAVLNRWRDLRRTAPPFPLPEDGMETATLVAHNPKFASQIVTREALAQFQPPVGSSTWRPVAHAELVGALLDQCARYNLEITREQYAVGKSGLALFGALDIASDRYPGRAMALGFRHSNDKALAVQVVAGARVFVCDNLALSGEKIALRKHSRGLHLMSLLREALNRWVGATRRFNDSIVNAEARVLSDDEAKVKLFDLRYEGVLPVSIFDEAAVNYFRADKLGYEDSAPRTAWGLHNACTRAVKALAPASQFRTLTGLGQAFGLGQS